MAVLCSVMRGIHAIPTRLDVSPSDKINLDACMLEARARETRLRVKSALAHSDIEMGGVVTTAGKWKIGGAECDLAVALALLDREPSTYLAFGELALGGAVRPCRGLVAAARAAVAEKVPLIFPKSQEQELVWLTSLPTLFPVESLAEAIEVIRKARAPSPRPEPLELQRPQPPLSMSDIKGLHRQKAELEDAIASGHERILLIGPPGTGKTMLARRVASLLDPLSVNQVEEVALIRSVAGLPVSKERPFRAPHYTASSIALSGGNSRPGEVTLAHNGVLFLDDVPEFERRALDVVFNAHQKGCIEVPYHLDRGRTVFPSLFVLIGAANTCPCGWNGLKHRECSCSPDRIQAFRKRLRLDEWQYIIEMEER